MITNQTILFGLMSKFTSETVVGFVSCAYSTFGPKIVAGDALSSLLIPFAEKYFNACAHNIQSRDDDHINNTFDEMTNVVLLRENHPMDILQIIVMLTLNCLKSMDIKDIISESRDTSLLAVKCHVDSCLARYKHLAKELHGCTRDHNHKPLEQGEKIFTFTVDRYTETAQGPVKLSALGM